MPRTDTRADRRKYPRAQLHLPARIRWRAPLGMRFENTHTLNVSREGFLLYRTEPCEIGSHVWVAFPFDATAATSLQPETPARVVRTTNLPRGGFGVALHWEMSPRYEKPPLGQERRAWPRIPLALPFFVRSTSSPWPEESMTQDISRAGVRFTTGRIFAPGDTLFAKIPWSPWSPARETSGRVIRIESQKDGPGPSPRADVMVGASALLTSVAVEWNPTSQV